MHNSSRQMRSRAPVITKETVKGIAHHRRVVMPLSAVAPVLSTGFAVPVGLMSAGGRLHRSIHSTQPSGRCYSRTPRRATGSRSTVSGVSSFTRSTTASTCKLVCHMALVADIVQQINIKLTYRTCKMMIFGSRYVTHK